MFQEQLILTLYVLNYTEPSSSTAVPSPNIRPLLCNNTNVQSHTVNTNNTRIGWQNALSDKKKTISAPSLEHYEASVTPIKLAVMIKSGQLTLNYDFTYVM